MTDTTAIRFQFSAQKALTAVQWMLQKREKLDLHTIAKAAYFADKAHLNQYGRPIFGATYKAMKYGPVPLEIYEMLKGEALHLFEIDRETYPWRLDGYWVSRTTDDAPDLDELSRSDLRCLEDGFRKSIGMNFNERTAATHGRDWQVANMGLMDYADMLDDGPEARERAADLRIMGRHLAL